MSKIAKIICKDSRFAKMLSLELEEIGVTVGDRTDFEGEFYTVADLDSCEYENLKIYSENSTLIGFTRLDHEENATKREKCATVLQRPFYISDLLNIFNENEPVIAPKSKRKLREIPQKPHFLTVDEKSSSALWGDMKIPLSEYEYKVLSLLCENRGEVVERERIYSLLGAEDGNMGDVYICHLRRKIDNKLGFKLIYTIRGKGYMLKN